MPAASAIHTLIVDDQMSMRGLIRTSLQQIGFREFREASDGEAGLREMIARPAHLVISDFNMPKLDGLVCCAPSAPTRRPRAPPSSC